MSASTATRIDDRAALAVAAGAGALYGLGLARCLFELDPEQFGFFGAWPGALALSAAALALAAGTCGYTRRLHPAVFPYSRWATLALALPVFGFLAPDVNPLRSITLLAGALVLCLLCLLPRPNPDDRPNRLPQSHPLVARRDRGVPGQRAHPYTFFPLVLFLLLFFLYMRTLAPAVGQADTFEFQVDVAQLGIAHGSGYPLLMLVGRLFTLLPLGGTLAFRANLSSAFFAALAAVGVERLARRLGATPLVALLGGLVFGVSPALWSRAVEIEVFALNAAFVAAILWLCVDLVLTFSTPGPVGAAPVPRASLQQRLMLLAFLFGLSLTNHLTTLFLGPACLLAALVAVMRMHRDANQIAADTAHVDSPPRRALLTSVIRRSSLVLLAFLLGLSVYLYLPLRWPAVNHGQTLSLAGFGNILTGNEAKGAFQWRLPFQDPGRYAIVANKIVGEYGWPGLGLALLGVISLLAPVSPGPKPNQPTPSRGLRQFLINRNTPIGGYVVLVLILATYLGYVYFELAFNVPDPSFSSYIIPLHLIAAVLMALGIQWALNLMTRWGQLLGRARLSSFAPSVEATPQTVAGQIILSGFCLFALHSIWQTFPLVDRSNNWSAQQFGELMLNQPLAHGAAILADSEKIAPLDYLQIAEGRRPDLDIIVLPDEASYRSALDERAAAGQVVYLGRYLPGLGAAYSLRSVGPLVEVSAAPFTSTFLAIQPASAQPAVDGIRLVGFATTIGGPSITAASSGEIDLNLIWQPNTVPQGNLLVNLRLLDSEGQAAWQNAGSVPVSGLYPTNAWRAGEIISDFYRLPVSPSLAPGVYQLQVAFLPPFAAAPAAAWSAVAPVTILPPAASPTPPHLLRDQIGPNRLLGYDVPQAVAAGSRYAVTLYWLRAAETSTVTALGETHSLAAWPADAVVPIVYTRIAPPQGDQISLAVADGMPAQCGWLAPATDECFLPAIRLAGQANAEGAVNFSNQILLDQAHLVTPIGTPGGTVSVNLEWQALRAMSDDYTVFVHLLGPDGLVHGQVDLWPVSGTRATSSWVPGEHIMDPYRVQLPADAPPGAYHIEIGLYLLATGQRLPVLNADGVPIDDRLLLGGLQVTRP